MRFRNYLASILSVLLFCAARTGILEFLFESLILVFICVDVLTNDFVKSNSRTWARKADPLLTGETLTDFVSRRLASCSLPDD